MKKIFNTIIITILLYICVNIFMNSKEVTENVIFSFDIWKNNIFPSLFPFFVISNLLINYGFVNIVSKLFIPITKLLKVSKECAFVIVMGILSGFPSSAKYVKELVDKNIISSSEATKVLTFTHFSNPLFIINTIGLIFLKNPKIGFLILIIHYSTNFIVGLIFRNYKTEPKENKCLINKQNISFGKVLTNSINESINSLLLILGTITFFLVITSVINNSIPMNSFTNSIINGIIEMTQGLKYVSLLNVSLKIKAVLSTMIISFGGISVHVQIISIIKDSKIKYFPFLIARIIHAIISGLLIFIIL